MKMNLPDMYMISELEILSITPRISMLVISWKSRLDLNWIGEMPSDPDKAKKKVHLHEDCMPTNIP